MLAFDIENLISTSSVRKSLDDDNILEILSETSQEESQVNNLDTNSRIK